MEATDRIEARYERLLFRLRRQLADAEARLHAYEDLVKDLASGELPFIHADHAAQALVATIEDKSKDSSEARDNPKPCTNASNIDWECGGCGLFLGSRPSPDFGNYPCVCGKKNRPRPVHANSHNHASRRKSR